MRDIETLNWTILREVIGAWGDLPFSKLCEFCFRFSFEYHTTKQWWLKLELNKYNKPIFVAFMWCRGNQSVVVQCISTWMSDLNKLLWSSGWCYWQETKQFFLTNGQLHGCGSLRCALSRLPAPEFWSLRRQNINLGCIMAYVKQNLYKTLQRGRVILLIPNIKYLSPIMSVLTISGRNR